MYNHYYSICFVEQRLLTTLNVGNYNITDQGADMITAILQQETVSLTNLDLSNVMLNSVKVTEINNTLKHISSLKVYNIIRYVST